MLPFSDAPARADLPPIVLFVDEHDCELDRCIAALEKAGLWVATSTVPSEALTAVDEFMPDLVILDGEPTRDSARP